MVSDSDNVIKQRRKLRSETNKFARKNYINIYIAICSGVDCHQ
uniref:Uncharacterized protein n=1 Tax=Anguilla anguilla TaxID=7936 RepID=A0A0E9P6S0_ANGAN